MELRDSTTFTLAPKLWSSKSRCRVTTTQVRANVLGLCARSWRHRWTTEQFLKRIVQSLVLIVSSMSLSGMLDQHEPKLKEFRAQAEEVFGIRMVRAAEPTVSRDVQVWMLLVMQRCLEPSRICSIHISYRNLLWLSHGLVGCLHELSGSS